MYVVKYAACKACSLTEYHDAFIKVQCKKFQRGGMCLWLVKNLRFFFTSQGQLSNLSTRNNAVSNSKGVVYSPRPLSLANRHFVLLRTCTRMSGAAARGLSLAKVKKIVVTFSCYDHRTTAVR